MAETRETRIKRLRMRSWRRGIKEMDLILGGFADAGVHVHVMHVIGWVMIACSFSCMRCRSGASKRRWPAAARPPDT